MEDCDNVAVVEEEAACNWDREEDCGKTVEAVVLAVWQHIAAVVYGMLHPL